MIDLKTLIERIITLISLTLIFSLSLKGQTVYNAVDFVDMNEGYTVSKSNIAQFSDVEYVADLYQLNFDTTGENMVWDFSLLEPLTQIADTMYDPAESGLVDALINDCHSACKWNHTCYDTCGIIEWDCYTKCHGVCTDSCIIEMYKYNTNLTKIFLDTIDFEVVQITDIQQMYLKTNSTLLTDKFGYKLSSFGIELLTDIIDYDSADVMYQFPLEYGNSDASTSSYEINAFDIIVWKHWQSRYNEVEGWGKLITPFGTFDSTLKVRTEIYTIDTIWWGGETFTIPDTLNLDSIVEYKWFSSDYGLPVLTAKMLLMNGHTLLLDVSYLDSLRCFDASANAVPLPPFAFLDSTDTAKVTFVNLSVNADSYWWNFDDPASGDDSVSTERNPKHYYTAPGFYQVELIACNNICDTIVCDTIWRPVFIYDSTSAYANFATDPLFACLGDSITFINLSLNDSARLWDFGDGNTSTDTMPVHYYSSGGFYDVMLVVYDTLGGIDIMIKELNIADTVTADFTYDDTLSLTPIQFSDASVGVDSNTFYIWTFTGGNPDINYSTEKDPIVIFETGGNVSVCISAWNTLGCKQTTCKSITLTNCISAGIKTKIDGCVLCLNTNNFCLTDTIKLMDNSTSDLPDATTYQWLVNDILYSDAMDTILAINEAILDSNDEVLITLITDNGVCVDTVDKWLNIKYQASIDIIEDEVFTCGDTVDIQVDFDPGNQSSYLVVWSPTDSLDDSDKLYVWAYPDSSMWYTVSASFIAGACDILTTYQDSVLVTVLENSPTPAYGYSVNGYTVSFTDSSIDAEILYISFGDGDTIQYYGDTTHTYSDTGTYDILYIVTNSCGKAADTSLTISITCSDAPIAGFSYSVDDLAKTVTFTDTSSDAASWTWNFGDDTTKFLSQNPTHVYADTGIYNVTLWAMNDCGTDSLTISITIKCIKPTAAFGTSVDTFKASFSDSSVNATSWIWDFGDGTKDSTQNPQHDYAATNTYFVTLWATNECGTDSVIDTVVIENIGTKESYTKQPYFKAAPNPYTGKTSIGYNLNKQGNVKLEVYNILGKKVTTLVEQNQSQGRYYVSFSAKELNLPEGIYFARLWVEDKPSGTIKLVESK